MEGFVSGQNQFPDPMVARNTFRPCEHRIAAAIRVKYLAKLPNSNEIAFLG